ncbi:Hypothetical predicted protein [Olea europaea subsp. europaea]|uniref:Uncharacterized protein n=1 Tax=Olea europaea subsp. europaea TaxID=158383 RepID=A0A8S0RC74_OLEEU|nr:Hypothetical predicted protein [Olea europaea subsp. europaea]
MPVLFKELIGPLPAEAIRKLLAFTGDKYEEIYEDEDKDDKYEDDEDDILLRDEDFGALALDLPDFRCFGLQDSIFTFVSSMCACMGYFYEISCEFEKSGEDSMHGWMYVSNTR